MLWYLIFLRELVFVLETNIVFLFVQSGGFIEQNSIVTGGYSFV